VPRRSIPPAAIKRPIPASSPAASRPSTSGRASVSASARLRRSKSLGLASASPTGIAWIETLARPYLRGFLPLPQRSENLSGYWFLHPSAGPKQALQIPHLRKPTSPAVGFFLGHAYSSASLQFLSLEPPECIAFAFVSPIGSGLHETLVAREGSLLRSTYTYIGWLTHRRPRFVFHPDQSVVLTRHTPMCSWPPAKHTHLSRNFYIETLCWLVRSALVRKFLALSPTA
jgi:hypothetical protein